MSNVRHCFGEDVDVFEVTGNKASKVLKKAARQIAEWEEDGSYSWYITTLSFVGDLKHLDHDWQFLIHAHR